MDGSHDQRWGETETSLYGAILRGSGGGDGAVSFEGSPWSS